MQHAWYRDRIEAALSRRAAKGLLRTAKSYKHLGPATIEYNGRTLINFGSNDYLGLSWHPDVLAAAYGSTQERATTTPIQGWGSGASPLVSGRTCDHAGLETDLALWKQADAALTFSSGFATNVSVISALANSSDFLFSDELNHASLIDGCRLAKAEQTVYRHLDFNHLESCLSAAASSRAAGAGFWIVTDTVFSMEGDACDVPALVELANRFDAGIIFDEAHAVGVYGPAGSGLADRATVGKVPAACVGTCSKALGSIGGYVVSNSQTIEYLRQFARGYVYSTAQPAAAARATCVAVGLCSQMKQQREQLRTNAQFLRDTIRAAGMRTTGDDSPIVPVYLDTPEAVVEASNRLLEAGFYVPAIRPPTVPKGRSLLRISISAVHSRKQLADLISAIATAT